MSIIMHIPPFLARRDVPKFFPVCQRVVDRWIAESNPPIARVGTKPLLRAEDVINLLNSMAGPKLQLKRGRPTKAQQIAKRAQAQQEQTTH